MLHCHIKIQLINELKKLIENGSKGIMPYDWFYFNLVKNVSKEKTFHPCQIPTELVKLLIKASTNENDDVFILFGGSGNEILLTKHLHRNYISCELQSDYYNMIIDRLNNDGIIDDKYKLEFMRKIKVNGLNLYN